MLPRPAGVLTVLSPIAFEGSDVSISLFALERGVNPFTIGPLCARDCALRVLLRARGAGSRA
jgi:hypothetical protein